jgi:tripartite-type tricarboxylate transporter receptor subunit TctC
MNRRDNMRTIFASLLIIAAIAATEAALAQYPQKPITLISAYCAGSVGDQVARGLAEAAKKYLSQPIAVHAGGSSSGSGRLYW